MNRPRAAKWSAAMAPASDRWTCNRLRRSVCWAMLLFWGAAPLVPAQTSAGQAVDLQKPLEDYFRLHPGAVGISVAVDSADGFKWQGAVGLAFPESSEALTSRHVVRIASNTKTYVSASIFRLQEMGKLSIEDPIGKRLPEEIAQILKKAGHDIDAIRIRHLLTHTSGLREHAGDDYLRAILTQPERVWTAKEQIEMSAERAPLGKPGEAYEYCDTGYVLLGQIIERESGLPLPQAIPKLLDFAGLGLGETWFEDTPGPGLPRAHQHFGPYDTYNWQPSIDYYGGGGLLATPRDMALFMRLLLEGKVLKEASSLETLRSLVVTPLQGSYRAGIWWVDAAGHRGWGHTGYLNSFSFYFPDIDTAIAGFYLQVGRSLRYQELMGVLIQAMQEQRKNAARE